jgi:peptidoglycan hydrolase CwlO-like protein
MRNFIRGALALGLLSCGGIAPAAAQVVSDPNAIRTCLCEQQFVLDLQDGVTSKRQGLESSQRSQASLVNQVETRRAQINVYNNAELDAFKQVLQQRDAAIAATADATKTYDDAAERYNQAVAAYNASCAGHSYDETVLRQVQAAPLACPRP